MAHNLILGRTESGKTTLAKRLAQVYRSRGYKVIVLDALMDPHWPADFLTSDRETFSQVVQQSRRCFVFVDEAGEYIGRYETEMHWLATRGRHFGHSTYFVCQRAMQIAKLVRDQCTSLFLFACSPSDAKLLADEFGAEALLQAPSLPQFSCVWARSFQPAKRLDIGPPVQLDRPVEV